MNIEHGARNDEVGSFYSSKFNIPCSVFVIHSSAFQSLPVFLNYGTVKRLIFVLQKTFYYVKSLERLSGQK
jgi:hypothetical protein